MLPSLRIAVVALALPLAALPLVAQRDSSRTVQGTVTNKDGAPMKGAIVHLKDVRALTQKSFITPDDGNYRFGQISATGDYELWADLNGKKSSVRSITSFDTKTIFTINLKLDR